jgi:predicted short-subunit dehydrogenase-like oxidoreductase (DUF2520 family)
LVNSRGNLERVRADVFVLAISDGAIHDVAARLTPALRPGTVVLHCAGAQSAELLDGCRHAGAATGVMHPLVSFPTEDAVPELAGTTFVIDGSRRAVTAARKVAKLVGARPLSASVHGPAYHAAAALLANGSAALATVAVELLQRLGIDGGDAELAIGALLRTVADNVENIGVPDALTGPVARGDATTIRAHRAALRKHRRALSAYEAVGPIILLVAREAGLSGARATSVKKALTSRLRG